MAVPQPMGCPPHGAPPQYHPTPPQAPPAGNSMPVVTERVAPSDPVKPSGGMLSSMTLKTKVILALVAVFCLLVAIIVPSVIATQGDARSVSKSVLERQQSIPADTFNYRTFQSCNDLAVAFEGESQDGITTQVGESVSYVVDPNWRSSAWTPTPSDYCEYCDCSSAPPRDQWPPGFGRGEPEIMFAEAASAPAAGACCRGGA